MKNSKKLLVALVCIVATFCVGCNDNQEVTEVDTVTSFEDFSTTTEVIEEIEEIEEIEPVEEIELTSIFTNEDAHTLYQELILHLADIISFGVQNYMVLELSEESKNELQKIQESEFYNVSWLDGYLGNRMGNVTDFNYAFLDIDNNGIDELFLLEDESLVEVFHIVEGEIKHVIASSGWKSFTQLRNDLTFFEYIDGSDGEYSFKLYEFTDNELISTNCYAVRNYNTYDYKSIFNLPAVDGEILFFNESQSSSFMERDDINEYLLDEQGEEEFNGILNDRYVFDTIYPINY